MPKKGDKVGKYEIVERIAKGGMGTVYKAKHPTLKRFVILKQLTLRNVAGVSDRFKREAALMIDFKNENIVQVYDHFRSGSSYYIVMEYVEGEGLDTILRQKGPLPPDTASLIFQEACKGLAYAHGKGVVHRDIKPANILISRQGEVKLVDFGIATTKEASEEGLTLPGMTLGTPSYMAPEQISDPAHVDERADIYSMGVVLYESLTGVKPFPEGFTPDTIDRINRGSYRRPKRVNPVVPAPLDRIVRRSMHHSRAKRYPSMQQAIARVARYTGRPDSRQARAHIRRSLTGEGGDPLFGLRHRGKPLLKVVGIFAAVLIVLGGGGFFYRRGYHNELFRPRTYGRVRVDAQLPSGFFPQTGLIHAFARLTGPDGRTRGYVLSSGKRSLDSLTGGILRRRTTPPPGRKEGTTTVTTGALYLPAGWYHLALYLEDAKFYRTFRLEPRVLQRRKETAERIITVELDDGKPVPIDLDHRVLDADTGESILPLTTIRYFDEERGAWLDWRIHRENAKLRRALDEKLLSGRNYRFEYRARGYVPVILDVFVERGVDRLRLEPVMRKEPGVLRIDANVAGLRLLIDGEGEGYADEGYFRYGETVAGTRDIDLREGDHELTIVKRGVLGVFGNLRLSDTVDIRSGRVTTVTVVYDADTRELLFAH